ncbi:hypothetical protein D9758_015931 [Tetrapyrgos nigripes]|uniref:F-box domain-containing protein n=1 Tax=Tetrapyrgos nigripes TaxID=182062 RepID=A0A8H5FH64_9AGAR|nr:hypothetical protein D9758_015931 [Tetrapyrgos nigripes]
MPDTFIAHDPDTRRAVELDSRICVGHHPEDVDRKRAKFAVIAKDIAQLTQEIERVEKVLDNLKETRKNAVFQLKMGEALLAPISRLSKDVLAEVFEHYCREEVEDLPLIHAHPADIISSVCALWKEIAYITPTLWSYIHISGVANPFAKNPIDHEATRLTLARVLTLSRDAPLHILFSCDSTEWHKDRLNLELLHDLFKHSYRWSSADILIDSEINLVSKAFHFFFTASSASSQQCPFPLLQSLHLCIDKGDGIYISDPRATFVPTDGPSLPALRDFSVTCYSVAVPMPTSPLGRPSWRLLVDPALITSLEAVEQFHDKDLLVLGQFKSLQRLLLRNYQGIAQEPSGDLDERIVHLSSITHLVIRPHMYFGSTVTLTLFSRLSLPNLTSLEISQFGSCPDPLGIWSATGFAEMVEHSSCNLRSLFLDEIQINLEDLMDLLRLTPCLTHLTFCEYGEPDVETEVAAAIFSYLTWSTPGQNDGNLPKLTDIDLRTRSFLDHVLMGKICDLLESRMSGEVSTLKYFRFEPRLSSSPDIAGYTDPGPEVLRFEELVRGSLSRKAFFLVIPDFSGSTCSDSEQDSDSEVDSDSDLETYSFHSGSYYSDPPLAPHDDDRLDTNLPNYPTGSDVLLRSYYG